MAKKSNKPYSSSRNRNNLNRVKKNTDFKKRINKDRSKSFDTTTRIRIDIDRLNDTDSLDTSFLEGRYASNNKNIRNNKKRNNNRKRRSKRNNKNIYLFLKRICFLLGTLVLAVLVVLFFIDKHHFSKVKPRKADKTVEREAKRENKVIDDNYLLLGTYHTDSYNFDNYKLDYHYVKVADKNYEISDVLDNMKKDVYDYNPSIVFIELGINDLREDKSIDDVVKSLEELIKNIKEHRRYAVIYVESLYPINPDMKNYDDDFFHDKVRYSDIKDYNNKIEALTNKLKVKYLDLYKDLSVNDKLNDKYSDDGIHLNDKGYKILNEVISKTIGDTYEKKKN